MPLAATTIASEELRHDTLSSRRNARLLIDQPNDGSARTRLQRQRLRVTQMTKILTAALFALSVLTTSMTLSVMPAHACDTSDCQ